MKAGAVALPALFLAGCAALLPVVDDPTRFYVLEVPDYAPATEVALEDEVVVGIARVRMPRYLEESGIAVREDGTRIVYSQRDRWAEPLEHGLTRLITETLLAEPVVSRVFSLPAQRRPIPDYDLHVSVSRAEGVFSPQLGPHAMFRANWELRAGVEAEVVAAGQVRADALPWNGQDFEALAGSLSVGVAELTRDVAEAIAGLR